MHQNYGPEGMALLAASRANMGPTVGIGLVAVVVYTLSGINGSGATLSYVLLAVALTFACVGMVRGFQAAAAGRRFRGGRPYIRRPYRTS
jgi:hypothetical protein